MLAQVGGLEVGQTWSFRGSKSRNKVSVGEPAEGSLTNCMWLGEYAVHICCCDADVCGDSMSCQAWVST